MIRPSGVYRCSYYFPCNLSLTLFGLEVHCSSKILLHVAPFSIHLRAYSAPSSSLQRTQPSVKTIDLSKAENPYSALSCYGMFATLVLTYDLDQGWPTRGSQTACGSFSNALLTCFFYQQLSFFLSADWFYSKSTCSFASSVVFFAHVDRLVVFAFLAFSIFE